MKLVARGLDGIGSVFYWASHTRHVRTGIVALCALALLGLVWTHAIQSEDTTIYPISTTAIRATLVNHYVRVTGKLLYASTYDVNSSIAGIIWQTMRFVPFAPTDKQEPLMVLNDNLPAATNDQNPVTLVGKLLHGEAQQPTFYMKVVDPPSSFLFDIVVWACFIVLGGVCLGALLNIALRRINYVLTYPFYWFESEQSITRMTTQPLLLWYGSLGPAYGDVSLRQIPISFKAIPAEARLVSTLYPDLWSVIIRHLMVVVSTTVATAYGPLPAVRVEFEDERGIMRNGVIAASHQSLIDAILDVLRFVGQ